MADVSTLNAKMTERLSHLIEKTIVDVCELTLIVSREHFFQVARVLRDDPLFQFEILIDVCGVDYLDYGRAEWETDEATTTGFSRGVDRGFLRDPDAVDSINADFGHEPPKAVQPRFASVYHLLSITHNHRVRVRVPLPEDDLVVPSVMDIWPSANWFEREAFDLFGIMYKGHPDLRRILTDYGFVGHPFRKDFPLIGNVEVRYDAKLKRVVYEPVSIERRVLEPKVIRDDNRYEVGE